MTTNYLKKSRQHRSLRACLKLSMLAGFLLSVEYMAPPLFAAEPVLTDSIDMSVETGQALTAVIDLVTAGKLDEAATALQPLREAQQQGRLNDYEASRVLQQALNLNITLGNHAEAALDSEALLQTQSLTDTERTATTLMLGKLYLQLENWSKALEHLQQVNERQGSSNQETLYLIGFGNYRLRQAELATQYLEQAVALDAARAGEPVYSLLGVIYVDAKNYPKAVTTYEKLLSAIPDAAQAESYQSTLASLYVQTGNDSQAKSTLQMLISKYPGSAKLADYQKRLAALN